MYTVHKNMGIDKVITSTQKREELILTQKPTVLETELKRFHGVTLECSLCDTPAFKNIIFLFFNVYA